MTRPIHFGTVLIATILAAGLGLVSLAKAGTPCEPEWSDQFPYADLDGQVEALMAFDDGTGPALYVGGAFTVAGNVIAHGIAKWQDGTWSALGSGMGGGDWYTSVHALAVFDDDSAGPHPPALYVGGDFNTAGGLAADFIARWDGATWSPVGGGVDFEVYSLAVFDDDGPGPHLPALYAGGYFTEAGGVEVNCIAKWDGTSWCPLGSGMGGIVGMECVYALTVYDDDGAGPHQPALYAGGNFVTAGDVSVNYIARWNGSYWAALGSGVGGTVCSLTTFDDGGGSALYAAGYFDTAGDVSTSHIARWDGVAWSALGAGTDGPVEALTPLDEDGDGPLAPALYAGGYFSFAGGSIVNYIARWDGTAWSPLGIGMDREVFSLAVYDEDGSGPLPPVLLAGGAFHIAGAAAANHVAQWSAGAWSPLNEAPVTGASGDVLALAVFAAAGPQMPALYVGGDLVSVGGLLVNNLARWDGAGWSKLGDGVNAPVHALTVFDYDDAGPQPPALYVGGFFTAAGDVAANRIARWDGTSWSALGNGLGGWYVYVSALGVFDDDGDGPRLPALYGGGCFTWAGNIRANNIARWDGTSWSRLGSGLEGSWDAAVRALTAFDDDGDGPHPSALYAGGTFTIAGGLALPYMAKWDGTGWSGLGAGLNGPVYALTVFDDDGPGPHAPALYVGGSFTTAGATEAIGIAKWDGTDWSLVGGGVWAGETPGAARAFCVFDDDGAGPNAPGLYVAGDFTIAGNTNANYVARWDGASWSALGSGVSSWVNALAAFDDRPGPNPPGLYLGGWLETAGGLVSAHVARWGWAPLAPADLDCDDDADEIDFWVFVDSFGQCDCSSKYYWMSDYDEDGCTTLVDYQIWRQQYMSAGGDPDELPPFPRPGDMNCDGLVDLGDINAFVLALSDPDGYAATFPDCRRMNADINDDGLIDLADVNAFVALLFP
jgi:hypothetical protein